MYDILIDRAANAVAEIANEVVALIPHDATFPELGWGWNTPPLTSKEYVFRAYQIAQRIRSLAPGQIDAQLQATLENLPSRIEVVRAMVLPHIQGSGTAHLPTTLGPLFDWIERQLPVELPDWETLATEGVLPKALARKLRAINAEIEFLSPDTAALRDRIKAIDDAHSAAIELPTEIERVRASKLELTSISEQIQNYHERARLANDGAAEFIDKIKLKKEEADALIFRCEEAYRSTTTQGLAKSFEDKSIKLSNQMNIWVFLLFVSLVTGVMLSLWRISKIDSLINSGSGSHVVLVNSFLSLAIISAPVWFSWIATKQISHRFRLAEDYGFKAAFSKAYEGYRKEAALLEDGLSARLFAAAINRLDEPPVRLIDGQTFGSPLHELASIPGFDKALAAVPEFREGLKGLVSSKASATKP